MCEIHVYDISLFEKNVNNFTKWVGKINLNAAVMCALHIFQQFYSLYYLITQSIIWLLLIK